MIYFKVFGKMLSEIKNLLQPFCREVLSKWFSNKCVLSKKYIMITFSELISTKAFSMNFPLTHRTGEAIQKSMARMQILARHITKKVKHVVIMSLV